MAKEYYLPYLGKIASLAQANKNVQTDKNIVFVTAHDEGMSTAMYSINPENGEMHQLALPKGGHFCIRDGDATWIAGSDKKLYHAVQGKESAKQIGKAFEYEINGLATLSHDRLAVLAGETLFIVSHKGGHLQSFELKDSASCVTADASGNWCVVGTVTGKVFVFSSEEQEEFSLSEEEKLHEGAVESLLFEPEELRFYSSGADRKLFSTFARGKLEPEDRGRDGGHTSRVTAMVNTPGERFITGSYDKSCKAWVRNSKSRPSTLSNGITKVENLSLVNVHARPHLVVHCSDNTLRLFILDASGKIGDQTIKIYDAYNKAKRELDESLGYKTDSREKALNDLSNYADLPSIEIIARQITADSDHKLREKATQLLIDTEHPAAIKKLFPLLKNSQEQVRELAFLGLQKLNSHDEFNNLDSAIASGKSNIAFLALERYAEIAVKDSRAYNKLVNTLNADPYEVRAKALFFLEALPSDNPAETDILALDSQQADLKQIALMQLYQRQLLEDSRVRISLKRTFEDKNPAVRRMAFLVSLLVYPNLAKAIRERHKKIHSDLFDIESFDLSAVFSDKKLTKAALPSVKRSKFSLTSEEYSPLLQAMVSKQLDIGLLGANCLALLHDPRAYGYLLQLSTETDDNARISVCESFAALGDERATSRLVSMCNDGAVQVRDAAFSAILKIYDDNPITAIQHGLTSIHADVRKRAQQTLIRRVKKSSPAENSLEWQLLFDRLNDKDNSVRSEAFKTILNLQLGGGEEKTLELLRQSIHSDIRREVQTEAMAEISKPWAMPLLQKFIEDPEKSLREDTLNFLLKRSKGKDLSPLALAIRCKYSDTRRFAISELTKNPSQEKQELLSLGLDDDQLENRKLAIKAIISHSNREILSKALDNQYKDVQLDAAISLARMGEDIAEKVLTDFIQQKEPEKASEKPDWKANVIQAIEGFSLLSDPNSEEQLRPLLNSPHEEIQRASAEALFWSVRDYQNLEFLRQHSDKEVQKFGSLASAIAGNTTDTLNILSSKLPLALRLGVILNNLDVYSEHLLAALDSKESQRYPVLLVILFLALAPRTKELLSVLGSQHSLNKLIAAIMLESSEDRETQINVIREYISNREDNKDWQISDEDINTLSQILHKGNFALVAKTLELFDAIFEEKPDRWNLLWSSHKSRYKKEIESLPQLEAASKTGIETENFSDLVFGTYLGLLREGPKKNQHYSGQHIAIKQSALNRLKALAEKHESLSISIDTIVMQTLGDNVQAVRDLAFDILKKRIEVSTLAEECLQTKHVDLGVKGLELLTKAASKKQSKEILSKVMCERQDFLAVEAAKMLLKIEAIPTVGKIGLASHNSNVRNFCAEFLLKDYENSSSQKVLHTALKSPYKDLRMQVAGGLAYKRDDKALTTLLELLKEEEKQHQQQRLINAILEIGSEAAASGLLDRAEHDPANTANIKAIFYAVGKLRMPTQAERLISLSENEAFRSQAFDALVVISGYDQRIENHDEERIIKTDWEEKQFPRHDDILEKAMQKSLSYGDTKFLSRMIANARWARSEELQGILETLAKHPDDQLRNKAIEALGWRLRLRNGRADALLSALEHKSPDTKFIAAETLAIAGKRDGFSILLSAVELMQNIDYRKRSVIALGKLADQRSLDLLLRLASDNEHALQEEATEAIGHLGESDKAEKILKLLEQFINSDRYGLVINAIQGLRWFNTRRAWELIRKTAEDSDHYGQEEALVALGFAENDEANRNVLFKILESKRYYFDNITQQAFDSAKRLLDASSLEPEIRLLKSGSYSASRDEKNTLDRISKEGSGENILSLVPHAANQVQDVLANSLLDRNDLKASNISDALTQADTKLTKVACDVLGHGKIKETAKETKTINSVILEALPRLLENWSQSFERLQAQERSNGHRFDENEFMLLEKALCRLIWVCGRRQVDKGVLLKALQQHTEEQHFDNIRLTSVMALAQFKDGLEDLASQLGNTNVEVRGFIASLISDTESEKIKDITALETLDRHTIQRMKESTALNKALKTELANVHYQAYNLPRLVSCKDVEGLAKVAQDDSLEDGTRLGAIEALSNIATNDSDKILIAIGESQNSDEELRKTAWRCLRRSKRIRAAG